MSTLAQVRAAIRTTLRAAIADVTTYARVVENPAVPCIIVAPTGGEFITFGKGFQEWPFDLTVLVPPADLDSAQPRLDELIDASGAKSIRGAIFAAPTLGLADVSARTEGISGYGFTFESVGVPHLGASIRLVVVCSGTA